MIKKEKGIALVSLIITIALMTIVASTVVYMSLDRFEINNLRKMFNDIELLQDKVSNYYLKYGVLPILRDNANTKIEYKYTSIDFSTNSADNETYYILDLKAMDGISLNYGDDGFKKPNTSKDVYIINEQSHTIYYVKGIEMNEKTYYTLVKSETSATDIIPPTMPEIKVLSGTQNSQGTYITAVELELVPGREDGNVANKTEFTVDNGTNWTDVSTLTNNMHEISTTGEYQVKIRSYDKNDNISENAMNLSVEMRARKTLTSYSESSSWLSLPKSYEGKLSSYTIYGNSTQDTTSSIPSPTTPIEVQSVGEETNNLMDITKFNAVTSDGTVEYLESGVKFTGSYYMLAPVNLTSGNTYYMAWDYETSASIVPFWRLKYTDGTYSDTASNRGAITVPADKTVEMLLLYNDFSGTTYTTTFTNIQLNEGSLKEYEPYGYKVPVKVSGKNLINVDKLLNEFCVKNEDESITLKITDSGKRFSELAPISLKAGVTYHMSATTNQYIYTQFVGESGTYYYWNLNTSNTVDGTTNTFSEDIVSMRIYLQTGSNDICNFSNFQIEEGNTTTEYVPYIESKISNIYLDEPLRKVGNEKDYIDFENKQVIRNIRKVVFTGTENFKKSSAAENRFLYYVPKAYKTDITSPYVLCDRLIYNGKRAVGTIDRSYSTGDPSGTEIVLGMEFSTLDEFTQYIVNQYNAGTPMYIIYPLYESDEPEAVKLPDLETFYNYTQIEVLTSVAPSKIEVTYDGYEIQ